MKRIIEALRRGRAEVVLLCVAIAGLLVTAGALSEIYDPLGPLLLGLVMLASAVVAAHERGGAR